jgi:hypothetical protein
MLNSQNLRKDFLQTKVVNFLFSETYKPCRVNPPYHIFIVHSLSHELHSVLGFVYDFEQEETSQELWGSTYVKS